MLDAERGGATPSLARERCVVCLHEGFEPLFQLERFPTFMGTTESPRACDCFEDMCWSACEKCGTTQLARLPEVGAVYPRRHAETLGATWNAHRERFERFVERNGSQPFEVLDRLAMDGAELTAPTLRVPAGGTLVHSHVLEHWRAPRAVLAQIAAFAEPGSKMILSVPAMDAQLAQGMLSVLNFEHTFHASSWAVRELLEEAGFEVVDEEPFEDHSVFYACRRIEGRRQARSPDAGASRRLAEHAVGATLRRVARIGEAVAAFDGPRYLFGAHIFSQYLLGLGLEENAFEAILDNSKIKAGMRLYGTGLTVRRPEEIAGRGPVLVAVHTGPYDREIRQSLRQKLGGDVVFC